MSSSPIFLIISSGYLSEITLRINLPSLVASLILIAALNIFKRCLPVPSVIISSFKPLPSLVNLEINGSSTIILKVPAKGLE
jgi:hypothetical protein